MFELLKRPSGFLPIIMSAIVGSLIVIQLARFGSSPQADEGTGARLFQILMPLQVPIIGFFALKWLPRDRVPALEVLAIQCSAAIAVVSTVLFLRW
jgi:hypothetical protein